MAPSVEISIPTTSLSATVKPYTLYNITLRLPLRSFTVQKRYSDFEVLHQALSSQAGTPPPVSLPQKSWFTRTTSSPELTEQRRKDLEAYLRDINSNDEPRWRNTTAWRAFLNLPSSTSSANSSSAALGLHGSLTSPAGAGAPITDPTVWLDCHRDLKTHLHDARLHLQRRDQAESAQSQHESSAAAKRCLVKASAMITALELGLRAIGDSDKGAERMGAGEMRRRRDLVSSARKERDEMEGIASSIASSRRTSASAASSGAAATARDKAALLGPADGPSRTGAVRSGRVLGGPIPETDQTRELDNQGVLQLQKQVMEDQNMSVEELRQGVARLKKIGISINDELDIQNAQLALLDEDADRLGRKVGVAKKRVTKIS